jgi:hypothetical protein
MKKIDDTFNFGVAFILAYIAIEQIDARYFYPRTNKSALESKIKCHDDPKKCWLIEHKKG